MTTGLAAVEALATVRHPYPLIRGGGLFLIFAGVGFLLGVFYPGRWIPFAIGGFAVGFTASGLSALLPSLGTPSVVQIAALVVAVGVELGLIAYVLKRFRAGDQRTQITSIMFVVGVHFVIMGLAHGPLIAALGLLTMANAVIGHLAPKLPLRAVFATDSLLKIGFGAWMLVFYPAFTYGM